MKCTDCGAELPFKVYGDVQCEYCKTANYNPIPEEIKKSFKKQPELIANGTMNIIIPGTKARFNVGKHQVKIYVSWIFGLVIKVDGKKFKRLRLGKDWVFGVGENYVKLVFGGIVKSMTYEVYLL